MVARFRRRPVLVEAMQLSWETWGEICVFLGGALGPRNPARQIDKYAEDGKTIVSSSIQITIPTLEGNYIVNHGDWIIKDLNGKLYSCLTNAEFEKTYEVENG